MRSQINLICAAADPRSRRRPGEQADLVRRAHIHQLEALGYKVTLEPRSLTPAANPAR